MARYLQFLRYRGNSVYGTVPAIFAVPCLLFIWHGTCHFCGTMPVIYMARYVQCGRYHACYLYGTVPAIFAVPCLFFIRDGTCHLSGTVPVIYRDSTCNFCGTVAILYTARYLQVLRYHAGYLYGTVPAIFAVPCLLCIRDGTCHEAVLCLLFIGTVPEIFAVPCPFCIRHGTSNFAVPCLLFIWHGTCHFCGTVPVIYTGQYLP